MFDLIEMALRGSRRVWNRARWAAISARLPRGPGGKLQVHLGCGSVAAPGFVNIDSRRMPHINFIVHELAEIKFMPAGSIDLLYLSHVLEHLPHGHIDATLRQFHRVLRIGGRCRISVPDFDLLLNVYEMHGRDMDKIIQVLMGGQDYKKNFHFSAFNADSLTRYLKKAGFSTVSNWDPVTSDQHDFEDWASRKLKIGGHAHSISLNLEAVKL